MPSGSARPAAASSAIPLDRRMFGALVEHMGRSVYSGIFEPDHPAADADGFRTDVLDLVRELGVTTIRYPGGNFVSAYRWEDGVGPVERRPARLDLAWHSLEPNQFGLDEFVRWTRRAGVEPMLALNLGTRGVAEALELLEYANHPGGSALSDLRIRNGAAEPHDIRLWCLGNELDGPWQVGHKTAAEYGRLAAETARAMRRFDPSLELVLSGSSGLAMPTFGAWETTILEVAGDLVDHISLHAYYEDDGDLRSFLASAVDLERFIERVAAIVDDVAERTGSRKRIGLSVDEWNVWYLSRLQAQPPSDGWPVAPRLSEDAYSAADAVVVGSLLIALLKHADRVRCACMAQLVNVIAPIRTEPGGRAWRQTTFYPFALTSANALGGSVVPVKLEASTVTTARYGDVPALDAVAALDATGAILSVFAVNRHELEEAQLDLDLREWPGATPHDATVLWDPDPRARNTEMAPRRVVPRPLAVGPLEDGRLRVALPPVSWAVVRLRV